MKKFVILLVVLTSCTKTVTVVKQEGFEIVKTWKVCPISVHDEISPKYRALLSNGDTILCSSVARVGDSVYYQYVK